MKVSKVTDAELVSIRKDLGDTATSITIQQKLHASKGIMLDESTIRGRFVAMGAPLSGKPHVDVSLGTKPAPELPKAASLKTFHIREYAVPDEMKAYIPKEERFVSYVERPIDVRLAMHYEAGKHPLTQGKQGTGKTLGHEYYAYKAQLPFFLISWHDEMKLHKLFGDKTIHQGNIIFKESLFVKATQHPSVILYDEINAIANANTFDFHALLQNRSLFVKDADNGNGRWYSLHPDCKIGFAMNPKSQKYIGGHIKPSNFLGRCTFVTYPEFTKDQVKAILAKGHPRLDPVMMDKIVQYFFTLSDAITQANQPIDISIRQVNNLVDLMDYGMGLKEAIEDAISGMLVAVSQPKAQDSFLRLAQAIWEELKK